MELGSIEMVKKYVENDFGIAIVPEFSVTEEQRQKRLHICEIKEKINFQIIAVITYRERYLTYAMTKFKQFLKEEIKTDKRFQKYIINEKERT
jgi:DNA-binding transcriptional LysR family regulator